MMQKSNRFFWLSLGILLLLVGVVGYKIRTSTSSVKSQVYFGKGEEGFCVNNTCISKNGNNYIVDEGGKKVPGNGDIIPLYIKKLEELKLGELISENRAKFAALGFDEENKVIVEMHGKKLEVGDYTPQYDGTYVRLMDKQQVYQVTTILDKNNLKDFKYWQQKLLVNLAQLQVKKVAFKSSKRTVEITKDINGKWEDEKLIAVAAHLNLTDYLGSNQPSGDQIEVEVVSENETVKYYIGKEIRDKNNQTYWATLDKKTFFSITKSDFDLLTSKVI